MIGRLRQILRGRSRRTRRLMLAALGVLALSVIGSALYPAHRSEHRSPQRPSVPGQAPRPREAPRPSPPVPAGQLGAGRRAARRFLAGYLEVAYGRGSVRSVRAATPALRAELIRSRARVTPVERRRHPRVLSLTAARRAPGVVEASALVEDGGVSAYTLRLTVREERRGWLVDAVDGG